MPPLKDLARDLARKAGVWGVVPVPLERIADALRLVPFIFEPAGSAADVVGAINHDQRVIYVRDGETPVRQRFILAHELGHAVLHEGENLIDTEDDLEHSTDVREIEANGFAVELLLPEDEFRTVWYSRRANTVRVGTYFGVSEKLAAERAGRLGLPAFF